MSILTGYLLLLLAVFSATFLMPKTFTHCSVLELQRDILMKKDGRRVTEILLRYLC